MDERDRFVLRRAGGAYWLLDAAQPGVPYRAPLCMNESGAQIWRLAREGLAPREIAARLAAPDEASAEEVCADVEAFLSQVREWMNAAQSEEKRT